MVKRGPRLTRLGAALALLLGAATAHADSSRLAEARSAVEAVDYDAARHLLVEALHDGGNSPAAMREIYRLSARAAVVLAEHELAEQYYRRWLAIDPDAALPADTAPKLRAPFIAAQSYIAAHGRLHARARRTAGGGIDVELIGDPLGMAHAAAPLDAVGGQAARAVAATVSPTIVPTAGRRTQPAAAEGSSGAMRAAPTGGADAGRAAPAGGADRSRAAPTGGSERSRAAPAGGADAARAAPTGGSERSRAVPAGGADAARAAPAGGNASRPAGVPGGAVAFDADHRAQLPAAARVAILDDDGNRLLELEPEPLAVAAAPAPTVVRPARDIPPWTQRWLTWAVPTAVFTITAAGFAVASLADYDRSLRLTGGGDAFMAEAEDAAHRGAIFAWVAAGAAAAAIGCAIPTVVYFSRDHRLGYFAIAPIARAGQLGLALDGRF